MVLGAHVEGLPFVTCHILHCVLLTIILSLVLFHFGSFAADLFSHPQWTFPSEPICRSWVVVSSWLSAEEPTYLRHLTFTQKWSLFIIPFLKVIFHVLIFRMRNSNFIIYYVCLVLCRIQLVLTQTSTATWQFPNQDDLTINYIDTVVLQWTSNYGQAWMNLWCQNGTAGNNVVLGQSFHG